jgi:molecular chaperone GrpE
MENDVKNQNRDEQQLTGDEHELNGQQATTEETDDSDAVEVEETQDELETTRAERDRYLDQLQRSVAEFANYRRRSEQERAQLVPMVRRDVLAQFLPVLDDFERAMAQVPEDRREDTWIVGLAMIESKFRNVLERSDVRAIDPTGEPFDPAMHESVASDPGTSGSTVVEVYQKGYAIGDVLIRPAMVKTGDPQPDDMHVPNA